MEDAHAGVMGRLRPLKDQVTPYKVALLVLVGEYCNQQARPVLERPVYTDSEEKQFLILLLQLVQVNNYDHFVKIFFNNFFVKTNVKTVYFYLIC